MLDEILVGTRQIPVYVLTGFLGSGKTTLLKRLITEGGVADAAILINEFGEMGIDDMLVRQVNERTVLLNSGCVCCSVRADLLDALRELFALALNREGVTFSRIIIETSGATDPVPVVHTMNTDPFLRDRFRLEGVISTLDASASRDELFRHGEVLRQLALADWVVVTKGDLVDDARIAALDDVLQLVNPDARVMRTDESDVKLLAATINAGNISHTEAWWRDLADMTGRIANARQAVDARQGAFLQASASSSHSSRMESFLIQAEHRLDWSDFLEWIEILLSDTPQTILRLKGIVTLKGHDRRAVVQGVRQVFYPVSWLEASPETDERTRIVLIVENPERISREMLVERILPFKGALSGVLLPAR